MNSGIEDYDDFYLDEVNKPSVESITIENLLGCIDSGIGLDIAKNHTGICVYENGEIKTYGFEIENYDKEDCHAEYKMRAEFKEKLENIVSGKTFEYCVVEDVYGGDNFDTVRKLLALNTVIDELICTGVCKVEKFYRVQSTKWVSMLRKIYKPKGNLRSKVLTQEVLEYLGYQFLLDNKNKSESQKKKMYFEDICDATGMLCGVVFTEKADIKVDKAKPIKMSDIKMYYVQDLGDCFGTKDNRVINAVVHAVDLDLAHIEKSILLAVELYPDDVMAYGVPSNRLGKLAIKYNLPIFDSEDDGYLIFYKK